MCAVRIDPNQIPTMEAKLLYATFLEAVIRFYENPIHAQEFEKWRTEKGGNL